MHDANETQTHAHTSVSGQWLHIQIPSYLRCWCIYRLAGCSSCQCDWQLRMDVMKLPSTIDGLFSDESNWMYFWRAYVGLGYYHEIVGNNIPNKWYDNSNNPRKRNRDKKIILMRTFDFAPWQALLCLTVHRNVVHCSFEYSINHMLCGVYIYVGYTFCFSVLVLREYDFCCWGVLRCFQPFRLWIQLELVFICLYGPVSICVGFVVTFCCRWLSCVCKGENIIVYTSNIRG